MNNLVLLTPEIFLTAMAFVVLLGEAFVPNRRNLWLHLGVASLVVCLGYFSLFFANHAAPGALAAGVVPTTMEGMSVVYPEVLGMIIVDSQAVFFKMALVLTVLFVIGFSYDYYEFKEDFLAGTYVSLLLFSLVGMMLLVGSSDFLMAVIGLEMLGISSFILTGFILGRRSSIEGAIKFFLVGTFSAGILLFGISYYYGIFGTTHLGPLMNFAEQGGTPDLPLTFTLIVLIAGLGFKLAMAPFHMWAPDAYEGAPTPVTALLSVAPKAAAIGFILRAFGDHQALGITPVLAVLAAITMTVGNVGAIRQNNVKRLLAYSSVAQVGYILVAFTAGGQFGFEGTLLYTFLYLFMNLGVFGVLLVLSNEKKSDDISVFAGLSKRSFSLGIMTVLFLLSMAGIPPLAGFIGKFAIFAGILKNPPLLWLGVVAVLNSVISLYYYFRIAQQAFFVHPDGTPEPVRLSPALLSTLVLTLGVTVVAGVLPNCLLGWVRNVLG